MEQKEKKILFLSNLFQHLDGIALIPTIIELQRKEILNKIKTEKKCSLSELSEKYNANNGYLNVALRLLCSQGILEQHIINDEVFFSDVTIEDWISHNVIQRYKIIEPLYINEIDYQIIIKPNHKSKSSILFNTLSNYNSWKDKNCHTNTNGVNDENRWNKWEMHIEGAILGPIIVLLSRHKYFEDIAPNKSLLIDLDQDWKELIIKVLYNAKIINVDHSLTEYGYFLLKRATSYGVTVSYLPTFRKLKELIYGNHALLTEKSNKKEEIHVDRSMNVWGSGGAHHTYFKKVDQIIIDLFNLPIKQQPKGFIDIGCGNGKLIEHIFDLIYYKTKRGKYLKEHPLFIVGSDFNYKALEATNQTINQADIWAKTAFGDISDPAGLAKRLKKEHNINLVDLLNVRSFLDHNRIYETPKQAKNEKSKSTGAFCYKGERLNNDAVEQNLEEHLEKWYPYLKKYGLLIVELHTINPIIASKNIGKTAITAYDASHGFSDQYILEYDVFLNKAQKVGLKPDPAHEYTFPSREIPIVSINRLISQ